MSPKAPDPTLRRALVEAAARLLVEHGPDALTTRRLAAEVGTSTMAVYTYFKGMDELRLAVAREGFDRLAGFLDTVEDTDDPAADVIGQGIAYFLNAITNPDLYRFMFQAHPTSDGEEIGIETFERLVSGVARAVGSGRFRGDPEQLASQLWASAHGIVTLHLAGAFTLEEAIQVFEDMGVNLFVGFGDDREEVLRSVADARRRLDVSMDDTGQPVGDRSKAATRPEA